jgi:ADP-heptose:LPS heptosyltransferase
VKTLKKNLRSAVNRISDAIVFRRWLKDQHRQFGKKLVIICRPGALGDILCTLPMCGEIRRRHPGTRLVFLTHADYKNMVLLSQAADEVFGAKSWTWPFVLPESYKLPGIVEAIYNPRTTDELTPKNGTKTHLIDDLAHSCNVTLPKSERQPRLFTPAELIKKTQAAYGLADDVAKGRLVICINCARSWPVKEWGAAQWQALIDKIHAEYDAVVIQFGFTKGKDDEYEHLVGTRFFPRLQSDELIALIAGCHLVVSTDSGPVHIAGGVGVPVVGLFGANAPQYRLPPDSPGTGLFSQIPCIFCHHESPRGHWQSGCPNNIRCMKELDAQTVFEAVKSCLAKIKRQAAD